VTSAPMTIRTSEPLLIPTGEPRCTAFEERRPRGDGPVCVRESKGSGLDRSLWVRSYGVKTKVRSVRSIDHMNG
jgi:hypothetical protein